jgi:Response regulator containing CheY-like receiver, AAA-type ATPase, and DNA-binding domains
MVGNSSILAVGNDPALLKTRALVLRAAGYHVVESANCEHALEIGTSDHIDAVVLCHSLRLNEAKHLMHGLRTARRLLPIVCVLENHFSDVPTGCLMTTNEPEELLRTLQLALEGLRPPGFPYRRES